MALIVDSCSALQPSPLRAHVVMQPGPSPTLASDQNHPLLGGGAGGGGEGGGGEGGGGEGGGEGGGGDGYAHGVCT